MFFTAGSAARQACRALGVSIVLAAATLLGGVSDAAAKDHRAGNAPDARTPVVRVDDLPQQAAETLLLIRTGGPFPYSKDGIVFGNREGVLPAHPRGYYREYTVKTVGARDRGARRIVCGGTQVKLPDACFYTDDHYASFRRIVK